VHCQGRHAENWDVEGLVSYLSLYFPIPPGQSIEPEVLGRGREALAATLLDSAVAAYQAKEEQIGTEVMRQVERYVMLRTIDGKWVDYLTQMEQFREGIGLRAYGQRDPLVEYKNEAFTMFRELTESIQADIVANMLRVKAARAAELQSLLAQPGIWDDPAQAARYGREASELREEVARWARLEARARDLVELTGLEDPELVTQLERERAEIEGQLRALE